MPCSISDHLGLEVLTGTLAVVWHTSIFYYRPQPLSGVAAATYSCFGIISDLGLIIGGPLLPIMVMGNRY